FGVQVRSYAYEEREGQDTLLRRVTDFGGRSLDLVWDAPSLATPTPRLDGVLLRRAGAPLQPYPTTVTASGSELGTAIRFAYANDLLMRVDRLGALPDDVPAPRTESYTY